MIDVDVAIVGAGPAGATLSILLARSGVRVALIEREVELDREFRGPAYQAAVVRIWDEMGVLSEILSLDHLKADSFSFIQGEKTLIKMDIGALPPPYNYMVVMKQAPLLRRLIQLAGQYPNFTYLGGADFQALTGDGIEVANLGKIKARLVVGADGRFSKVRQAANIPLDYQAQGFDIVWFEVPAIKGRSYELGFRVHEEGLLLYLPKEGNKVQVGFVLDKGAFVKTKKRGLASFKEILNATDPDGRFGDYLEGWDQCELLDVKMGTAREWCQDGLLLIGDAAHIASPVGAMGNKFAIEDAAIAHPILLEALKNSSGRVLRPLLQSFEKRRRKNIETGLRLQRMIGNVFIKPHTKPLTCLRNLLVPIATKTKLAASIRQMIALSPHPVHVDKGEPGRRQYLLLTVKKIIEETKETRSLVFDRAENYRAGQFLTLRILKGGRLLTRCYSLSSAPDDPEWKITIKRCGLVSSLVHDQVKEGDKLLLLPPSGTFIAGREPTHYLMIAAGSGITPIFSLIRDLLANTTSTLSLLYINHDEEGIIFKDQLKALESDRFTLTHHLTAKEGRPDKEAIRRFAKAHPPSTQCYLCGPEPLRQIANEAVRSLGIDKIHEEVFLSATSLQEEVVESKPLVVGHGEAGVPPSVTIRLGEKEREVRYEQGQTLLDAALAAGLDAPFSCQEGICATCRACLIDGEVIMDKHTALSSDEVTKNEILTCRAKPTSASCTIDYNLSAVPGPRLRP